MQDWINSLNSLGFQISSDALMGIQTGTHTSQLNTEKVEQGNQHARKGSYREEAKAVEEDLAAEEQSRDTPFGPQENDSVPKT